METNQGPPATIPREIESERIEFEHVPLRAVRPSTLNPRKRFDESALLELVESIRQHGILEPLVVRYIGPPERRDRVCLDMRLAREPIFEVIAGERRWRAARIAGLERVPCVIRDVVGDAEHLELALVENLNREDIDPIEQAEGYRALAELGHTQAEIAAKVGRSQAAVANALRLLKLPEASQEYLRTGALTVAHGKALARFADFPEVASALAEIAVSKDLKSKDLETGLPYGWELEQKGLVEHLRSMTALFDIKTVCESCPFQALLKSDVFMWCLRPDHYKELQEQAAVEREAAVQATIARLAETAEQAEGGGASGSDGGALAACKVVDLASTDLRTIDLSYEHYQGVAGCSEACPCRGLGVNRKGEEVPICLDPARFGKLREQQEKDARKQRREAMNARLDRVLVALEKNASRAWSALATAALRNIDTDIIASLAKQHGVAVSRKDYAYGGDLHRVCLELERLDAKSLLALALGAIAQDELKTQLDWSSRATPFYDYLLGEKPKPKDAAISEDLEDDGEYIGDDEEVSCSQCNAGIPMDLFGGSVTAEFPYGKDKSGLARYLDTGLLVYAALDGECDDPDYIDAAFCADCVAAGIQICKGCGCTDQVGCAGGCYWAEDNLCSQCVPAKTDDFSDPECTACHQRRARPGLTVCQPCLEAQREAVLA